MDLKALNTIFNLYQYIKKLIDKWVINKKLNKRLTKKDYCPRLRRDIKKIA